MVDPDPHNVSTKCKEHQTASEDNISAAVNAPQPNYPSDGKSGNIKRVPFFTRAEMSNHIAKSGNNIDSSKSHLVPTSVRKATTFLNDEYLRTCQQRAIILISICAVSAITTLEKIILPTT